MKISVVIILILFCISDSQSQIRFTTTATFNSIGYSLSSSNSNVSSKSNLSIIYKKTGDFLWKNGFSPSYDNQTKQWRGSLFLLDSNTQYNIKLTLIDSSQTPQINEINDSVKTLAPPAIIPVGIIKYVSPFGSGTAYSSVLPGSLKVLLTSEISCGTTVMLRGGNYSIGNLTIKLNSNCTEETPIVFMAAPGETPVFDGGDTTRYIWKATAEDSALYSTTVRSDIAYTSLCLLNKNLRLYPYGLLIPAAFPYPSLSDLGYDLSGFYRKDSTFYFKTLDHRNPNNEHLTFSNLSQCITVQGNNKNNYLYFSGITFKYFAKPIITKNIFSLVDGDFPALTLSFKNTNHVVLDNCHFEYCNWPINFSDSCNYSIVQNCTFQDGVGKYSHGAFKQTRDVTILEQGTYGRYMEYAAINFSSQSQVNIIRNNSVDGYIGGLVGKSLTTDLASEETDIYNNKISNSYNGINADGGSINSRIWNNTVGYCSVGLSFINASFGPNYIFRNIIHHIIERKNHNDIFFMDCDNISSTKIWGTGIKLNASARTINPPDMIFVHNTFHTADTLGFDMYLWNSTWKSIFSRNNIYYSEGKSSFFLDGIQGDSLYNFNSQSDCYYNKNNILAIIQPMNGIPKCIAFSDVLPFDEELRTITGDNRCSISKAVLINPVFSSISSGNYELSPTSLLIDKGEIILGFNDSYSGLLPDIGAREFQSSADVLEKNKENSMQFSIYPNPATSTVSIRYLGDNSKEQFDVYSIVGQKLLSVFGEYGQSKLTVKTEDLTAGMYFIRRNRTGEIFTFIILNN